MQSLPTVLLRHITRTDTHYDWLLADPRDPNGKLWTARCPLPAEHWRSAGTWLVEPIHLHRRLYLTYQGSLSDGRGSVLRVDEGWFRSRMWTGSRIVTDVRFCGFEGCVEWSRLGGRYWKAAVI